MRYLKFQFLIFSLGIGHLLNAQILGVGGKLDKEVMFQASFNVPIIMSKDVPYDLAFGVDFTTKNNHMPSGLQLQSTGMYFFHENSSQSRLVSVGLTAGYLFDFNTSFENQFRLSPHFYAEFGFLYFRLGYDYYMPLDKGAPFISMGIGGGYLFRHFKLM